MNREADWGAGFYLNAVAINDINLRLMGSPKNIIDCH